MIAAVVLAAGASTRYGSAKQVVFLPHVLRRLAETSVGEVVVVQGAHPLPADVTGGARVVECPDWALGPGGSLRCGLAALGPEVEAALIVLADGPYVDTAAVVRLIERRGEGPLVVASYDGTRDHPAVLSRSAWGDIPDEGARALEATLIPCDDLEPPGDMDYPHLWQPADGAGPESV